MSEPRCPKCNADVLNGEQHREGCEYATHWSERRSVKLVHLVLMEDGAVEGVR